MILSTTLPRAWKAFTENKRYLIFAMLFEFVLFFSIFYATATIFVPTMEAYNEVQTIMNQELEKLPETELYQLENVIQKNEEFLSKYKIFFTYIIFFFIIIYALTTIFKLPLWYFSHKSILKKMPFGTTAMKFVLLCLFWFIVFCASFLIYSMATGSTETVIPLISSPAATLTMYIIFIAIWYFSQISFALIPAQQTFKKTFVYGIKHAKTILPAFIVNAIITFIVFSLPFNWTSIAPKIGIEPGTLTFVLLLLAIIIFTTAPALAFARIHMITATWQKSTS